MSPPAQLTYGKKMLNFKKILKQHEKKTQALLQAPVIPAT
jgi:hypothetical protein